MICGPEFGEYQGKKAMIRRALYGGKSAGTRRDYWFHLCSCNVWSFLDSNPVRQTLIFG